MSANTIVYVGNPNTYDFNLLKTVLKCYDEQLDVIDTTSGYTFYKEFYSYIDAAATSGYEKIIVFDTTYQSLQAYADYLGVKWYNTPKIRKEVE